MKLAALTLSISALVACGQEYNFTTLVNSGLSFPTGVVVDSLGNVYVADYAHNKIQKIDPGGTMTVLAGSGVQGSLDGNGTSAQFHEPIDVAVDSSNNVYVADRWNNTIRKITPVGDVTTWAGTAGVQGATDGTGPNASFKYPHGLAVDSANNVYVADRNNHIV